MKNKYQLYLNTYQQLCDIQDKASLDHLLTQAMSFAYRLNEQQLVVNDKQVLFKAISTHKGINSLFWYRLSLALQRRFNMGYRIYKKSIS